MNTPENNYARWILVRLLCLIALSVALVLFATHCVHGQDFSAVMPPPCPPVKHKALSRRVSRLALSPKLASQWGLPLWGGMPPRAPRPLAFGWAAQSYTGPMCAFNPDYTNYPGWLGVVCPPTVAAGSQPVAIEFRADAVAYWNVTVPTTNGLPWLLDAYDAAIGWFRLGDSSRWTGQFKIGVMAPVSQLRVTYVQ